MSDAGFDRIRRLFQEALDQPEDERASWRRSQCGGDEILLQEVRSQLKDDSPQDDPLEDGLDQAITDLDQTTLGNASLHEKDAGDHLDTVVEGGVFFSQLASFCDPRPEVIGRASSECVAPR